MYTRDFGVQNEQRTVPEDYHGSLFSEEKDCPLHTEREEKNESGGVLSVFRGLFDKPFDIKGLPIFKKGFGTEELLIIGIAAFLFFSKDGDKESAIILLLTLLLS